MTNEVLPDIPALAVIDNAECWHSDGSHKSEPYGAIAVHALQNPESGGGDTELNPQVTTAYAIAANIGMPAPTTATVKGWLKFTNRIFARHRYSADKISR